MIETSQSVLAQRKDELTRSRDDLKRLVAEVRALEEKIHRASLALSESRSELKHLAETIQERHNLNFDLNWSNYYDPEFQDERVRARAVGELGDLRTRLERLGPVNPSALEEYQALAERKDFLEKQVADLTASMENLKKAIRKINRTTLELFMDTFRSVAARMEEICPILFGEGAKVELTLTDPDNPLESGVEIKVQPPGKKLVTMSLLSGGEKAMSAVSLVFAIFLHKPSPFCILDEVDAPLDENNVARFNGLLREIGRHSQILMITHNRRTMEVVDTLYGVTMPEPGVSRLVSVNLEKGNSLTQ